jgi:steroid delta-isomerase-like uncharacterized protein
MSQELIDAAWASNEAFGRSDWDAFGKSLAPNFVYEEITTGRKTEGVDETLKLAKAWKSAFSDACGTADSTYVSGNTVIFEITWTGTHDGPLPMPDGSAVPPSGKPIAVKAVMVSTVDGGKITHQRHHLDMLGLLTQVGAIPSS